MASLGVMQLGEVQAWGLGGPGSSPSLQSWEDPCKPRSCVCNAGVGGLATTLGGSACSTPCSASRRITGNFQKKVLHEKATPVFPWEEQNVFRFPLPGGATRSWYVGWNSLMVSSITWMVPMKIPARQP